MLGSLDHPRDGVLDIAGDVRAVTKSVHQSISFSFLHCSPQDVDTKHLCDVLTFDRNLKEWPQCMQNGYIVFPIPDLADSRGKTKSKGTSTAAEVKDCHVPVDML